MRYNKKKELKIERKLKSESQQVYFQHERGSGFI